MHYSLGTKSISTAVSTSRLSTLISDIRSTSKARHFYRLLLSMHQLFDMHNDNNLTSRVKQTWNSNLIFAVCSMISMCFIAKRNRRLFSIIGLQTQLNMNLEGNTLINILSIIIKTILSYNYYITVSHIFTHVHSLIYCKIILYCIILYILHLM